MGVLPHVQKLNAAIRSRAKDFLETSRCVAVDGLLPAPLAPPSRNACNEHPRAIAPTPEEIYLDLVHLAPTVAPHARRLDVVG